MPHHHMVLPGIQRYHIEGALRCDSQAPPLSDRIVPMPRMVSQDVAFGVDDITLDRFGLQQVAIIATVEILALILLLGEEPVLDTQSPGFLLVEFAQRKHDFGQLCLGKTVQEVGLVLAVVHRTLEQPTATGVLDLGIMPGGELVETDSRLACDLRQSTELDEAVAPDAGIGRPSRHVFAPEVLEDNPFILRRTIENMVLDSQQFADPSGLGDIFLFVGSETGVLPQFTGERVPFPPDGHGDTDNFVTSFLEQQGCDRGIDSSAHTYQNLHISSKCREYANPDTPMKGIEPYVPYTRSEKNQKTARDYPERSCTRVTGLEPAIYGVTGRRDNQLRYTLISSMEKLQCRRIFVNTYFPFFHNFSRDRYRPKGCGFAGCARPAASIYCNGERRYRVCN